MMDRFDASSDQRILNHTQRYPSPDHPGAVRCEVELPWGESFKMDFEKMDYNAATSWCATVRGMVDARYDSEEIAAEQRARRAQTGGAESRSGGLIEVPAGVAAPDATPVPAPETRVERDASPASILAERLARLDHAVEACDRLIINAGIEIEDAQKRRAEALAEATTLRAALEVLNGGNTDQSESPATDGGDIPNQEESRPAGSGPVGGSDDEVAE